MKTTTLIRSLKAMAIIAAFAAASGAQQARAGEVSVYLKSGWFTWDEKLNGNNFVKEKGVMSGAGITNKDNFSPLSVAEVVEVWGGNLDYDGHDVTGTTELKSDTCYLGTKEEVALGLKLSPLESLSLEPFAAVGHKFWIRTRSGEDWNSFYAKAGVTGEVKTTGCTFFVRGGALVPVYTRTHVALSGAGFSDVVIEPKSQVSGFAEGGMKLGDFALSFEYEGMAFGESDKVATTRTGLPKGVVIQNSQAFQPESHSGFYSLKLAYSF